MAGRNASPTSTASAQSAGVADASTQPPSRASSAASPPLSTPPTSVGDEHSVVSDAAKMDAPADAPSHGPGTPAALASPVLSQSTPAATPSGSRRSVRSSRASVATYNVQILAGTAIHTPTKYLEKHHGNVLHGALQEALPNANTPTPPKRRARRPGADDANDPAEAQLATETAQAAARRRSSRVDLRKEAFRNLTAGAEAVATKGAALLSSGKTKVQNALGAGLAAATGGESAEQSEDQEFFQPKTKQWERQGLYVGQHREFNARLRESQNRRRRQSQKAKENSILPQPMFRGESMLNGEVHRDFKLPYDVYHPLPRKVKVDGWVKLNKNRFIGDASALWKRDKQDSSQCYCEPEDGCGESCHNRIMAYECDATNCRLTPEQCRNRPFAQLKARAKGNGYDYGVEVMETGDKGYGVRAMRTFEPHQIIVEYAGEIITQTECERRMKQVYKKDKCYYLMSFDNKMIIDATRGTIARFVNHSCEPNCEMIKWTVSGEPRMALFAGSRGIMTGDELTYDYNFDPFSQKNIQQCRCGTRNCRGVLGPKPKHQPQSVASSLIAGTKRRLQDMFGSGAQSNSAPPSPHKKRKLSMMPSATVTKTKNALAEKEAAEGKAEREAAEKAAQKASREDRALSRSTSMTISTTRHLKTLHKVTRRSLPALKGRRQTGTINTSKKTSSTPSSQQRSRQSGATSLITRKIVPAASKGRKRLRSPSPKPVEDESPNITPASLRSASRKNLTQTKLPFQALGRNAARSSSKPSLSKVAARTSSSSSSTPLAMTVFEVPDSDHDDYMDKPSSRGRPSKRDKKIIGNNGNGFRRMASGVGVSGRR